MIFDPKPLDLPTSYETVPTSGHVIVKHHPPGAPTATPVVVVTLNRPKNQNAFTGQMVFDFEKLFALFDVDERVKVIVLTGAGKTFCAGADLDIGFQRHVGKERPADHRDGYAIPPRSTSTFPLTNPVAGAFHLLFIIAASPLSQQCKDLQWEWA